MGRARVTVVSAVLLSGLLLSGPASSGGGLEPTTRPSIDPADAAHVIIEAQTPSVGEAAYARGGRFVGDLDGDGTDDIALQASVDAAIELFFSSDQWGLGGLIERGAAGDTQLVLPGGCRLAEEPVRYVSLGDVDGDGMADLAVACREATDSDPVGGQEFGGIVALYFGRPQPWGPIVSDPDTLLRGTALLPDAITATEGNHGGFEVAPLGDLDGDGFSDFFVSGQSVADPDQPVAWIFHGSPSARTSLQDGSDATWVIEGGPNLRCEVALTAVALGDVDAGGFPDFALGCSQQPIPFPPPEANDVNLGFGVFLGENLAPGSDTLSVGDRDFGVDFLSEYTPRTPPFAALGNLDGVEGDEFAVIAEIGEILEGRIIQGHGQPWDDVHLLVPYIPFQLDEDYDAPEGLEFAPAGDVTGRGPGVWIRLGRGDEARIGLLEDIDPSTWSDLNVPPVSVVFSSPGAVDISPDWRLGLGGAGDANGDGINDLLILSGFEDATGCHSENCGGAWLILCTDFDSDGVSACGGDCDDRDGTIAPTAREQCDDVDHDCDGDDGQDDEDEDGFRGCDGDCDDDDEARFPDATESCGDLVDVDCDGLGPDADADGDGSLNCEDCQPWSDAVQPGVAEICDGQDTDCNGQLPQEEQDIDQDGWLACSLSGAEVDCDDRNPFIHPFRFEDCTNGIDDDCNGEVDEDRDEDGDQVSTCQGDCYDQDADVYPGASEQCDGLDNDCDGSVDIARDLDEDGFSSCSGDCDDGDAAIHPQALAACDPEVDANCDGQGDLADNDGDGFTLCTGDCDDQDPGVHPQAHDYCDRRDEDCDGVVDDPFDRDQDLWATCLGDCDDGQADRYPQPIELICNDLEDGDCDDQPDSSDSDCPAQEEPSLSQERPYGLSCSDCQGTLTGGASPSPVALALFFLALLGVLCRRSVFLLALGTAVLVAGVVPGSAEAARKTSGIVVYLAPQPDLRHMVEANKAVKGLEAVEVLHSSEVLGSPDDQLIVVGARAIWICPKGGRAPRIESARKKALDRLIELDPKGARSLLDEVVENLYCLDDWVSTEALTDVFFYRAVAALQSGDPATAKEDFATVIAFKPDHPGDPNFPPNVNAALDHARGEALPAEPAVLHGYIEAGQLIRVDGRDVDFSLGGFELRAGRHLIQLERKGRFHSAVFVMSAGAWGVALHSEDGPAALQSASTDPGARRFASAALGMAAADAGVDLVAVVDLYDRSGDYIYKADQDSFSFGEKGSRPATRRSSRSSKGGASGMEVTPMPINPSSGAELQVRPSSSSQTTSRITARSDAGSGVFRFRVSGGYSYVHPWSYIHIPVDFGVRLWEGLHLDFGLEVSTSMPGDYVGIWLPSGSLGVSYRVPVGPVEIRLGGVGRVSVDKQQGAEARPLGGWGGVVGVDFMVPGAGPLLLGVDVEAGMLGKPFYLAVSAGAGLRL